MYPDRGRLRHYRDFYRPVGTPRPESAPLWLIWGNCQAEAVRLVLDSVPDRPYRTARIPPVHELQQTDLVHLESLLSETAVLLTQPVRTGYRDLPLGVADLVERLPRSAAVVRWPVIRYAGLYPFQAIARHPADRSITPPVAPYHDLRTVAAAREGRGDHDRWDADVSADQIRTVAAASIAELTFREQRDTDVGVADILAGCGADAAHTINHPGNSVLDALGRRLLATQEICTAPTPIVEPLLDSAWAPLERRVIDALGISATPRPRWRLDGRTVDPNQVHVAQLDWYRRNPDFVELTISRHRNTMATLGLLDGPR